jgi:hypothetical protein
MLPHNMPDPMGRESFLLSKYRLNGIGTRSAHAKMT